MLYYPGLLVFVL